MDPGCCAPGSTFRSETGLTAFAHFAARDREGLSFKSFCARMLCPRPGRHPSWTSWCPGGIHHDAKILTSGRDCSSGCSTRHDSGGAGPRLGQGADQGNERWGERSEGRWTGGSRSIECQGRIDGKRVDGEDDAFSAWRCEEVDDDDHGVDINGHDQWFEHDERFRHEPDREHRNDADVRAQCDLGEDLAEPESACSRQGHAAAEHDHRRGEHRLP